MSINIKQIWFSLQIRNHLEEMQEETYGFLLPCFNMNKNVVFAFNE